MLTKKSCQGIIGYTEKMWFLGTDILEEKDLLLMEEQYCTSFSREYGAIYYINNTDDETFEGYSETFHNIVNEARKRKYVWIFFDRDITTEFN